MVEKRITHRIISNWKRFQIEDSRNVFLSNRIKNLRWWGRNLFFHLVTTSSGWSKERSWKEKNYRFNIVIGLRNYELKRKRENVKAQWYLLEIISYTSIISTHWIRIRWFGWRNFILVIFITHCHYFNRKIEMLFRCSNNIF